MQLEENYERVRDILSPFVGVPLPKNEITSKLLHSIFKEEEAFIIAKGVQKGLIPVTERRIRKRTNMEKAKLKRILTENGYKHTQVASRIMLKQAQDDIGTEAYMY